MAAIGYMLIILIKSPLWIAQWGLKNKAFMLVGIVVLVAVIAVGSFSSKSSKAELLKSNNSNQTSPALAYTVNPPPTTYIGRTPSRIFYIQAYTEITDTHALLTDYYSWDGRVWQHAKIPLDAKEIKIQKR